MSDRMRAARAEVDRLRTRLEEARQERAADDLAGCGVASKPDDRAFAIRRRLRGHFGKVYAMEWGGDSKQLVSAGQEGRLLVWNAWTENKLHAVSVKVAWIMTTAYEKSNPAKFVASGGLDNVCSIFDISSPNPVIKAPSIELTGHDGYLSSAKFLSPDRILTASGDSTCAVWDLERKATITSFRDHGGDVMSVALTESDPNVFVSGSVDCTAKIWDIRTGEPEITFVGHESDINAVDFMRNGRAVATGSDDFTLRMFDMRALSEVSCFTDGGSGIVLGGDDVVNIGGGVSSAAFSLSGKYLFAGYEDDRAIAWDTTSADPRVHVLQHSEEDPHRISCVGVNSDGTAVCTGSWDMMLAVWA